MLPSSIVVPPPLPHVTLADLLGPVLPLAIGVVAAGLGAMLVGLLLRKVGAFAAAGGRRRGRTDGSAPAAVRLA